MDAGVWLLVALGLPFALAASSPLMEVARARSSAAAGAGAGAAAFVLLLLAWRDGGTFTLSYPWIPSASIAFTLRLDPLALLFALLITGVGAAIFAYAYAYMEGEEGLHRFFAYLSLFMGSMLGIALAADLILLFLFWELTTLSSFLLIGFHTDEEESSGAALKALVITGVGGIALLVAFLGMGAAVGTFDLAAVLSSPEALRASPVFLPILILFMGAVATKSAQFPLHIWLPDAMVAPTPVSAYLHSAAMVKAGVYLAIRFLPALASPEWEASLIPLGMATMVVGGLLALRAVDLKRILAYSTVSQLGLLASAFGFASVSGQEAGLFHLLNHALFKASLFLVAGGVTAVTGIKDIRGLGGLRRGMPLTATACALAVLSMAGIPPLGGFLSKEIFFEAALDHGAPWAIATAIGGGALTFAYSLNFFSRVFLGSPKGGETRERASLALPALILASLTLALGIYPPLAAPLVEAALHSPYPVTFSPSLLKLHLEPLLLSGASVALGLALLWRYGAAARAVEGAVKGLGPLTFDGAYRAFIQSIRGLCRGAAVRVQNGSLRRYSLFMLLAVLVPLLIRLPPPIPELPLPQDPRELVLAAILLAMVAFAALAAFLRDTLHAVLSLSGMGFLLATAFMLLNAPDLAMTQILVEMVFLVMFLVVLHRIPARAVQPPRHRGPLDGAIAIAMVVGVTYLVTFSFAVFYYPSVALFYLRPELVEVTGGNNVVNVIITDFRAFDTLGETTVVGLAALAVYTLLRRWRDE
jgi:multicomponent Na+:H+ antiporter subunit A